MLWLMTPLTVQIVGAPVACAEGVKETWRDVAPDFSALALHF
jgi:hypothetical protein